MNAGVLWDFHDRYVLRAAQEYFYAYPVASMLAMFAVLVCLPSHRKAARILAWAAIAWVALCLVGYGMLSEAPTLAWFLIGLLAYRFLRWVLWTLPAWLAGKGAPCGWRRWRPRAAWTSWAIRDYFRADPRGVYWLDLARAVRGLAPKRTPAMRRSAAGPVDLPAWRARLWKAVFRLIDMRIWVYGRLPRWWHRPFHRLDLDEPHVRDVLAAEAERAYQEMSRAWTGSDFADYCHRSAREHQRQEELAGRRGKKSCLHREALAEAMTCCGPWRSGDPLLLDAAWFCYVTWRRRRQHDMLWHRTAAPPAGAMDAELDAEAPVTRDEGPVKAAPQIAVPPIEIIATPAAAAEPAKQPGIAALQAEPGTEDEDDDPTSATDEELFAGSAVAAEAEALAEEPGLGAESVVALAPSAAERLADLKSACRMLEAYLGLAASGKFSADAGRVEPLLADPHRRLPATMLLMLYCLCNDHTGLAVDRQKVELLHRMHEHVFGPETADEAIQRQRRLFAGMHIDVLFDRGEYAQVVELFRPREDLGKHACRVLADAETAVARSLNGQDVLRDLLRYEAIGHYFQAGFRGVWTLECARLLLDHVENAEEMVELFRQHPVEIARPGTMSLSAARQVTPPPLPQGPPTGRIVVGFYRVGQRSQARPLEIPNLPYTFGAGPNVDTRIRGHVAPRHITLARHRDGLCVHDVSRGEGILVDGEATRVAWLRPGTRVQFGNVMMEVISV